MILMYHRVTGDTGLELDVRSSDFRRQIEWLARHCEVVSLQEGLSPRGVGGESDSPCATRVVITFDDAYEDFYSVVLPVLRDANVPATLYVPTAFIDDASKVPVSKGGPHTKLLRPLTWEMLRELSRSPLITLAAHSHGHSEYPSLSDAEILRDIAESDRRFDSELGFRPRHFAYPRGAWDERCERIVAGRYESIALVGGGSIDPLVLNPHRLTRIPVLFSDGFRWFKHRVEGRLIHEESIASMIRGRRR
ncbi:MAG: polysaccharide deacetylase family protein [Thauera sp.]|nr:polysaccharide deacetylase family protein [Thauera sp.]